MGINLEKCRNRIVNRTPSGSIVWSKAFVLSLGCLMVIEAAVALARTPFLPGLTERVSVSSNGVEGDAQSLNPSISTDGRYVVFDSEAGNLVAGDYNGIGDTFVRDRQLGTTTRITGGGGGGTPMISADGRFVAFASADSNLVPGDTNWAIDIFVYELANGQTERVSVDSEGQEANGGSLEPFLSSDGTYVAFISHATNLSPWPGNGWPQVFLHDRQTGVTEMVSLNTSGEPSLGLHHYPTVSADGRYIAFASLAGDLVPNDTNGDHDIFVRDRQTGVTERLSMTWDGQEANEDNTLPVIAANGRYVVFYSEANNLIPNDTNSRTDIFVRDLWLDVTERVSVDSNGQQVDGGSGYTSISADGRYVAFNSGATNLVTGDTNETSDIFLHDRQTGATERVNLSVSGEQSNGESAHVALSADGRYIVFESYADNLVPGDTNEVYDVFLRDRPPTTLTLNYATGAPGSYFTLTGSNYPLTATTTITVNGYTLGDLPTDGSGSFTALLTTANADPGAYFVTAGVSPYEVTVWFVLDPDSETRPQEGIGPIFDVPAGIAWDVAFFPLMRNDE